MICSILGESGKLYDFSKMSELSTGLRITSTYLVNLKREFFQLMKLSLLASFMGKEPFNRLSQ